jgi:pentatricopeptide repeat protein
VISYSAAISACEKGLQYKKALELLREMEERGIQPNVISYNTLIQCSFAVKTFGEALSIVKCGQKAGLYPHFCLEDVGWDLHGFSLAVACMLLVDALLYLVCSESSRDLVIVTGQGRGSGPEGPILKSGVPRFLQEQLGLETLPVANNPGCFLVQQMALSKWKNSNAEIIRRLRFALHRDACFWTTEDYALIDSLIAVSTPVSSGFASTLNS